MCGTCCRTASISLVKVACSDCEVKACDAARTRKRHNMDPRYQSSCRHLQLLLNFLLFSRHKNIPEIHKYFLAAFTPGPFNFPNRGQSLHVPRVLAGQL